MRRPEIKDIPPKTIPKWDKETLKEGYIPFPKKLLRVLSEVMRSAEYERLQVILSMVDYLREDLTKPPSVDHLAHVAGLSVERFKEIMLSFAAEKYQDKPWITLEGSDEMLYYCLAGFRKLINDSAACKDARTAKAKNITTYGTALHHGTAGGEG